MGLLNIPGQIIFPTAFRGAETLGFVVTTVQEITLDWNQLPVGRTLIQNSIR